MRRGRQEDSQEFLRYLIDNIQTCCLKEQGEGVEIADDIAETSWIFRMFGGHMSNSVICTSCGFCSERVDSFMDISLDIDHCKTIKDCLRKFTSYELLKGENKWKCEKYCHCICIFVCICICIVFV